MINPMMFTRMAAQGTKVIHSRQGTLGSVIINTGASSAVVTVYNNTAGSGDVIAVIDASAATGNPREYNIACPKGLTAVMSGGNADITITSEGPEV